MKTEPLGNDILQVALERSEAAIIDQSVHDLVAQLPALAEASLLDELQARAMVARERLPRLRALLREFAAHRGAKVLLIDASPYTGCDAPTPRSQAQPGRQALFPADLYRGFILGVAGMYGYGFSSQQHGLIHNNIMPVQEFEGTLGHNASSSYDLGLHTEVASYNLGEGLDVSPDFVTLHFFRNQERVPTTVSIPQWDELPADVIALLAEPWFQNVTSPAQGGSRHNPKIPVSILYGPENDPWIRLSTSQLDIRGYSGEQVAGLLAFIDHLKRRTVHLPMSAGTIALIDNRRALHGRDAHAPHQMPRYDGTDRWQRRITASTDAARIWAFEASPRVVDIPRFVAEAQRRIEHGRGRPPLAMPEGALAEGQSVA
jgi:L-asparagine oxygenase